jgi:hypothetical protein
MASNIERTAATFSSPVGSGAVLRAMVGAYAGHRLGPDPAGPTVGERPIGSPAVAARTQILLPPSEGKTEGGRGAPWTPGTQAIGALDGRRGELLGLLGPDHAAVTGPTRPAIDRYSGVLYKELDAATITGAARRRLNANTLVVSGLWGLVAPKDPIPYYKLKMAASMPPLGKLSTWWRPAVTAALTERTTGAVVWDLLPNEHVAAIDWTDLRPKQRVTVRFLDADGKTISHWNKLLKGSIVRWLAETGTNDPRDLADFDHPQGYRLDPATSTLTGPRADVVLRAG